MKKIGWYFIIFIVVFLFISYWVFNDTKQYFNEDFGIETYVSLKDMDSDGIDDQTDILKNAKKYIAKKPKYKSNYYSTGYPTDEYGVCTDVVGYALKESGYNIMSLVNQHIKNNKNLYNIDKVDINIDFRRVRNLDVYFKNTAIVLTNDIYDIKSFQGGDIVVFKNHIGIVSDRRNKKGINYVIHHSSKYQIFYEQDILEQNKVIGHYRIS